MREKEQTQVVIDETTIYEIDLACLACDATEKRKDSVEKIKQNPTTEDAH